MNGLPNWVDLVVLILVFRACYVGIEHGALTALLTLIGAVSATVLTVNSAGTVWKIVQPWSPIGRVVGRVVAFWTLFVICLLLVRFLIRRVAGVMKWERVHWLLQAAGLLLGAARGVWWSAFLIAAFVSSGVPYFYNSTVQRSMIAARLVDVSGEIVTRVADQFPGASDRGEALVPSLSPESSAGGKSRRKP